MKATRGKGGFTLIEIIVVIIVAGIIFPAIIMPFYYATRGIHVTIQREIMEMAIQGEIEKKIMPAGYTADGWSTQTIADSNCVSQAYYYFVDPEVDFDTDTDTDTGYKRFTVTVTPTQGGSPLEVVLVITRKSN